MPRLPQPGGDKGTWGSVLNEFLLTSLHPDGSPKDISQSKVTNLVDELAANNLKQTNATHTGEVTGSGVLTIAPNVVTNTKLATMPAKTYKGNTGGTTLVPTDIPITTLKTDLVLVKEDVGLGSVDNTSDANKPVSSLQAAAIALRQPQIVVNSGDSNLLDVSVPELSFAGITPQIDDTTATGNNFGSWTPTNGGRLLVFYVLNTPTGYPVGYVSTSYNSFDEQADGHVFSIVAFGPENQIRANAQNQNGDTANAIVSGSPAVGQPLLAAAYMSNTAPFRITLWVDGFQIDAAKKVVGSTSISSSWSSIATESGYYTVSNTPGSHRLLLFNTAAPTDGQIVSIFNTVKGISGNVTRQLSLTGILGPAGPAGPPTIIGYLDFGRTGTLTTSVGTIRWPLPNVPCVIEEVLMLSGGNPVGSNLIIDIKSNGTTIFAVNGSNRPFIAPSAPTAFSNGTGLNIAVTARAIITQDITQVGSTTAGSDLTVRVRYREQ